MQLELPIGKGTPNARTTDPISSHYAVKAMRTSITLADLVIGGVFVCSTIKDENGFRYEPVTDDQILEYAEQTSRRRHQRNVIAKIRGLLEKDGFFTRIPGDKVQVIPSQELINHMKGRHDQLTTSNPL